MTHYRLIGHFFHAYLDIEKWKAELRCCMQHLNALLVNHRLKNGMKGKSGGIIGRMNCLMKSIKCGLKVARRSDNLFIRWPWLTNLLSCSFYRTCLYFKKNCIRGVFFFFKYIFIIKVWARVFNIYRKLCIIKWSIRKPEAFECVLAKFITTVACH